MKTQHKHAEIIKAWADGAAIQIFDEVNECWDDVLNPRWKDDAKYQIKPTGFNIGEFVVPFPYMGLMESGQHYYTPCLYGQTFIERWIWRADSLDHLMLGRGLVHLTEEAAFKHGRALAAFSENIENA